MNAGREAGEAGFPLDYVEIISSYARVRIADEVRSTKCSAPEDRSSKRHVEQCCIQVMLA